LSTSEAQLCYYVLLTIVVNEFGLRREGEETSTVIVMVCVAHIITNYIHHDASIAAGGNGKKA